MSLLPLFLQRDVITRLVLLGWNAEQIATRLHVTSRTIRDVIATATFRKRLADLQREHFVGVDAAIARLLHRAVKDPRGHACTLTHSGHPLQQAMDDMSDEQRVLAREFLQSI